MQDTMTPANSCQSNRVIGIHRDPRFHGYHPEEPYGKLKEDDLTLGFHQNLRGALSAEISSARCFPDIIFRALHPSFHHDFGWRLPHFGLLPQSCHQWLGLLSMLGLILTRTTPFQSFSRCGEIIRQ